MKVAVVPERVSDVTELSGALASLASSMASLLSAWAQSATPAAARASTAAWPGPTSGCRADRSRVKVEASDLVMAPEFVADDAVTVCCAWASGPDQEAELERQQSVMSAHCSLWDVAY